MVQRVIALVLAVVFVAAAIFLVPTDPGSAPTAGSAAQPVAVVPGAQPADIDAGAVPTEPSSGEVGVGAAGGLHARHPEDPPGVASDEVGLKCEALVKRLQEWGGDELAESAGRAALKTRTEAELPGYCDELNKLSDAELKKAIQDQLAITVP